MTMLCMPDPEANGFVHTLNRMGYMTSWIDPYSRAFVDFAAQAPGPVLDVGAAYGIATLAALERGAHVIANDMEAQHLQILQSRVPLKLHPRLSLSVGKVPDDVDLPPQSLGAVLVSRVLHFFDGRHIEWTAQKLARWLAPGGKVFIVADTPYLRGCEQAAVEYHRRRKKGDLWPGHMPNLRGCVLQRAAFLPRSFHFLDGEVLARVFGAHGFILERCELFARHDYPADLQLDGREGVGYVGVRSTYSEGRLG